MQMLRARWSSPHRSASCGDRGRTVSPERLRPQPASVCLQESEDPLRQEGPGGSWANVAWPPLLALWPLGARVDERGLGVHAGCLSRLGTGFFTPELAPWGGGKPLSVHLPVGEGLGLASAS